MISLLDVNLLIALAWPNHVHHRRALEWFDGNRGAGWATCPMTQTGFVRVSSNTRVLPEARTPREAIALLQRMVSLPGHHFWEDDIAITGSDFIDVARLTGHRQVGDAHLLAIALRHGGRLATLDRGIRGLVPSGFSSSAVCLLTAPDSGESGEQNS